MTFLRAMRIVCLGVAWCLAAGTVGAEEESEPDPIPFPDVHPIMLRDPNPEPRPMPELWFPVGENMHYVVYWGAIPVADTYVSTRWVRMYNRVLLQIQIRTQTGPVLGTIYPVDDVIESIIDPHTFLPLLHTVNLKEGRYRKHEITMFDYENNIAYWRSETRDREDTFELEPGTRDLVSFSYYMRKEGFARGERRHYRVMTDEKIYDLWLEAKGDERVRLKHYGRVSSLKLVPEAAFEGLFVRKGRITLWVSNDERRLLTQMEGSIPVASIRLVLQTVDGPGNDRWVLDY